ncbi:MAG: PDZ domain-containing protein, partial [Thermodesulfobacteriota bacterium]
GAPAADPAGEGRPLAAHQIILDRNIFDAKGPAAGRLDGGSPAAAPQAPAAVSRPSGAAAFRGDLTLIGTMVAGADSLAVVRQGGETRLFRRGDPVDDGVAIGEIARNTVILEGRDGSRHTLSLPDAGGGAEPGEERGGPPPVYEIQQTGASKWTISRQSAEFARAHVSELLNQARMEPRIIGDQVSGFLVRRIQPGSFLQQLGLRRGDVVMGVNGVAFNSPEQLLQILQQLREARSIRVDLRRDDQPLTFEYETR